jgi:hypothetical protein
MNAYIRVLRGADDVIAAKRRRAEQFKLAREVGKYGEMTFPKRKTEQYACLSIQNGRLIYDSRGGDSSVYRKPDVWVDVPRLVCRSCGEEKPASTEYFPRDARNRSGFDRRCHCCEAKRQRKMRRENRTVMVAV